MLLEKISFMNYFNKPICLKIKWKITLKIMNIFNNNMNWDKN